MDPLHVADRSGRKRLAALLSRHKLAILKARGPGPVLSILATPPDSRTNRFKREIPAAKGWDNKTLLVGVAGLEPVLDSPTPQTPTRYAEIVTLQGDDFVEEDVPLS